MKMLVPLDMNGEKIMNANFDLKFGSLFKLVKCYYKPPTSSQTRYGIITKTSDNHPISFSIPVILHAVIMNTNGVNLKFDVINLPYMFVYWRLSPPEFKQIFLRNFYTSIKDNNKCSDDPLFCIFDRGIIKIVLKNFGKQQFDIDIVISYI